MLPHLLHRKKALPLNDHNRIILMVIINNNHFNVDRKNKKMYKRLENQNVLGYDSFIRYQNVLVFYFILMFQEVWKISMM